MFFCILRSLVVKALEPYFRYPGLMLLHQCISCFPLQDSLASGSKSSLPGLALTKWNMGINLKVRRPNKELLHLHNKTFFDMQVQQFGIAMRIKDPLHSKLTVFKSCLKYYIF